MLPMSEAIATVEDRRFYVVNGLTESTKFNTGEVIDDQGEHYFYKSVLDPSAQLVRDDLENEVCWNQDIGTRIEGEQWKVPQVEAHDPAYRWAVFEYIDGTPPREQDLAHWLLVVGGICAELFSLPLGREEFDASQWYQKRVGGNKHVLESYYLDDQDRAAIYNLLENDRAGNSLKPGVTHGDIKTSNLILLTSKPQAGLIDAEFGTMPSKPDWDWPRLHDMAYFYHMLRCQHHSPELAVGFAEHCWDNVKQISDLTQEEFVTEFYLSVLERTISMMGHFIVSQSAQRQVDDSRRLQPEPYIGTIRTALENLS